ncbi:MAG: DNA (cytosine-5-)-methyltransferase [Bacteroidaceae bacterium]|nr:DNA (cytosine-5-)-methyltransferase [Bacteroidaceae bacterium]
MKTNEFSLFDFCKKQADKIQVFGEETLDQEGRVIPFIEQAALVTHYLQLKNANINLPYTSQAEKILNLWYGFIRGEKVRNPEAYASLADSDVAYQTYLFSDIYKAPFQAPENPKFTFIDLFAGMGGFRLAMQAQGGRCVFSSEWNEYAQKTYMVNFGEVPFGDITKESTKKYIPKGFDVLCAGFPCQPFSIAGVSKKKSLGRETGFKDKTQGTLFFDVADIINRYRPKAFFLENVKNLVSHDKGNTFRVIRETLEELHYSIHYLVMDGKTYVPQHRERIMIVGFNKELYHGEEHFTFPEQKEPSMTIGQILEPSVDKKYTLSDNLWRYLQDYSMKQQMKGNGFGYGLVDLNGITRTLSARYYKDGSEILIPQGEGINPRRLTPRECARLMGYPDNYILSAVSDVQAYRQCGNSVVVPLITAVSKNLAQAMLNMK